ncbi:MAG: plastocyanin/azurin family copper-binding protein [Chryseosolibacter sp.]
MLTTYKIKSIFSAAIGGAFVWSLFSFLPVPAVEAVLSQGGNDTTTITLNTVAGLQFDVVRFTVSPGANIKVILTNKDDMSHNLVFTKPGKRASVVDAAMKLEEKGPSMDYIPGSPDVLWSLPVLSPGEVKILTFTAPKAPGIYPYVCTFPGHGFSMYGAMYVSADGKMPELRKDQHIPLSRRGEKKNEGHASHSQNATPAHSYELKPPYLYRAYMKDASPASIAVHLPHALSYCWDTEVCELRYAWEGGFVDNTGLWKGKPNSEARILGTVFYRNGVKQPLRVGSSGKPSVVGYKGYRLVNRYPEFHYTLDGVDVYEVIHPTASGDGLIRTFNVTEGKTDLWFHIDARDGMKYESSAGKWQGNTLRIPAADRKKFTIVMTKKEEKK